MLQPQARVPVGRRLCSHVSVAAPTAAEGAPAPAAAADAKGVEEPTFEEMQAWLMERGLLNP